MKDLAEAGAEELRSWVAESCSKIVNLFMSADPKIANLYFESAELSGYSKMFITTKYQHKGKEYNAYPINGVCCPKEIQGRYDNLGNVVEDNEKINIRYKNWYFCFPRKQNVGQCCIVM